MGQVQNASEGGGIVLAPWPASARPARDGLADDRVSNLKLLRPSWTWLCWYEWLGKSQFEVEFKLEKPKLEKLKRLAGL